MNTSVLAVLYARHCLPRVVAGLSVATTERKITGLPCPRVVRNGILAWAPQLTTPTNNIYGSMPASLVARPLSRMLLFVEVNVSRIVVSNSECADYWP